MITYELNAEDVANLIKAHLCLDVDITVEKDYTLLRSDSDKFFGMVKTYPVGPVVLTGEDHKKIAMGASSYDYTSLFIAVTPEGVFQYNLSLLRLEFETYTDEGSATDISVVDLDISNATQILEWYPEFATEDEYIDALMGNGGIGGVDESDTW